MGRKAKDGITLSEYAITTIKKAIIDKGMNGSEFSEMLGRDDSYISHVFSGQQTLTPRMLELICRVLEIDKEALQEPSAPAEPVFDMEKFIEALKRQKISIMDAEPDASADIHLIRNRLNMIHDRIESMEKTMKAIQKDVEINNEYMKQLIEKVGTNEERLKIERAIAFLKDKLKSGHCDEVDVYREADEKGISRLDIADARKELGIVTTFKGYGKNAHNILIYSKEES